MYRIPLALAVLATALLPARTAAQPGPPASVQIIDVKIEKGRLAWTETQAVPVKKVVVVTVNVNGMNVMENREVVAYETVTVTRALEPKGFTATDAAGKAIDADKLAELLKETTPVVLVSGPIPDKHRALFKDKTVFIQLSAQPIGPGGLVPPPVPVPVVPPKM